MKQLEVQTWPIQPLGDLAQFRNGLNFNKESFGSGLKVVGVSDFGDRLFAPLDELAEINPAGLKVEESLLRDGDILFVRSNGNRNLIGRSLLLRGITEPISHSAFTIRMRFNDLENSDPRYYAYLLKTDRLRHALSAHGGGTNISNLNQDILNNLRVPVPPIETQRQIANTLSAYDDLIENNTRRIAILEEMAQRLYREWFVHFRYPGHESVPLVESELGLVPDGWQIVRLGAIADVKWGNTKLTKASYVENGFTAYSASGPDGSTAHYENDRTGIVLSAIGANCGNTWYAQGRWTSIKNTIRFWSNTAQVPDEYLFFATRDSEFWPKRGAAQPFISQGDAQNTKLLLPSTAIMNAFSGLAGNSLNFAESAEKMIRTLVASRNLAMNSYFP